MKDDDTVNWEAVEDVNDVGDTYDWNRHLLAQQIIDEWTYTPKQASGTMKVSSFVQELIQSGRVKAEDMEGIETHEQVLAKVTELLMKKA
jgi:hypothetical protein